MAKPKLRVRMSPSAGWVSMGEFRGYGGCAYCASSDCVSLRLSKGLVRERNSAYATRAWSQVPVPVYETGASRRVDSLSEVAPVFRWSTS